MVRFLQRQSKERLAAKNMEPSALATFGSKPRSTERGLTAPCSLPISVEMLEDLENKHNSLLTAQRQSHPSTETTCTKVYAI